MGNDCPLYVSQYIRIHLHAVKCVNVYWLGDQYKVAHIFAFWKLVSKQFGVDVVQNVARLHLLQ